MKRFLPLLLLLTACHKKPALPPKAAYPVTIVSVEEKAAPIYIDSLGHVESINSVQIKSRIEGELTGVYFKQGQEVKKNDLLFTIDPKPYQAAMQAAASTLEENMANQSLAAEKVKRYRILAKDEYYSQIDYETLQSNLASTTALVGQNQAQLDSAKINLDYCTIYSPLDGLVGILQVDQGNLVANNGTTLTTINQMAPIYVTFSIPEFQLHRVQKYNKAGSLKVLAAFEEFDEAFEGKLYMVDNAVNPDTGMIAMRALFDNDTRALWPGQFIRTRIILYTMENALVIPYTAVQLTQNGPIVFVLQPNNTVQPKQIKLGQRENGNVVVLDGLNVGDKIVLEGQLNLFAGAQVAIRQ